MVNLVVEGLLDEHVARRVLTDMGIKIGQVHGKQGKPFIIKNLRHYNQAAEHSPHPWIILIDLDHDEECAPPFLAKHLPHRSPRLILRIVVREIEAWLLADREQIANYLRVSIDLVPHQAEKEGDPKKSIITLAKKSSSRIIREDMVPREDSGAKQGPLYVARLTEFTFQQWSPKRAAERSDSLRRFIQAVRRLMQERK